MWSHPCIEKLGLRHHQKLGAGGGGFEDKGKVYINVHVHKVKYSVTTFSENDLRG
jgi:hypothetical protein